ncbi:MAG TPA: 23S rRNA (guanosine(2251)-2'-O)-methyltransferase RlmB [Actinomycetota bacterium]|nr:23S rRNA (guanosine(2251)-2'-O)-methyltransferase RlmB [Actinomycetota bacterium]
MPGKTEPRDKGTSVLSGRKPVVELLRARRPAERILMAAGMGTAAVLTEIRKRAEEASIPVKVVPRTEIDRLAEGENHQGVVAVTGRFRYAALEDLFGDTSCLVFLDGVTDPHNLGSLIRTAECCGFDGVVIPTHRSVAVTPTVRRVAAGAAEVLPVARVTNLGRGLDQARTAGLWIVGLDGEASDDIWSSQLLEAPVGIVLGAEGRGLSRSVRDHCDALVRIPQSGRIGSLNVGVAGAVAMFEVARRRNSSDTL